LYIWTSLESGISRCSRERNNIPDITHPGYIHKDSLKTKAKSSMRNRPVFPQIQEPLIIFDIHTQFLHPGQKDIISFLSLAAAYNLPYLGHQALDSPDALIIIIQTHIEGFYIFRIISYHNRFLKIFLGQISFMVGLEVN